MSDKNIIDQMTDAIDGEFDGLRAEIERLRAENEKLRAALKECAQDLEAEINARYQIDGKVHPAEQRKYDRDMSTVRAAAAALKETE